MTTIVILTKVCLLMILNINTHANVIFEHSLCGNEGRIGVNETNLDID